VEEIAEPFEGRLVVVSNRLPYVLRHGANGSWDVTPGSGGLVTALHPVLRNRGGIWIGWPGTTEQIPDVRQILADAATDSGYELKPVAISAEEMDGFYHGYSNEVLWPLFHDLQCQCNFVPEYWHTYVKVNRRFAHAIAEDCHEGDFVWVHDYQLMDVAHHLRELGCTDRLAFFLHIPFPAPDMFLKLPERHAILSSLLAYDFVGVQTQRDRRNLVQCIRMLIGGSRVRVNGHLHTVRTGGREMHLGSFPIGIDSAGFTERASLAAVDEIVRLIKASFGCGQLMLGIDRLDYTKGIPQRLKAFANLLERFPEVREQITLIQIVVPSRAGVPKYEALKLEIEQLVGEINGRYSTMDWVPVHYMYRALERDELLAYYRACGIALITPLKDGMNLVCKEFCACSSGEGSVLILSQFAGAAAQLGRSALLVNPYDVEQTADAIYNAFRMSPGARCARMRRLRRNVREQDTFWWVDSFMRAAINRQLKDFPVIEEYVPEFHGLHA
jgi:trehalose 6-phosphate synthase/phosphatase